MQSNEEDYGIRELVLWEQIVHSQESRKEQERQLIKTLYKELVVAAGMTAHLVIHEWEGETGGSLQFWIYKGLHNRIWSLKTEG